jgi:hypothetical protein
VSRTLVAAPQRRLIQVGVIAAVVALGCWIRLVVLRSAEGSLNADEATMAIAALDIRRGALPIVLEGQAYTAVLESYPATVLIALFGPHPNLLKLIAIALWGLGSLLLVGAAREVTEHTSSSWIAGLMCWITPGALLVISTRAYPGYSIGLAAVAASLWATGRLLNLPAAAPKASAMAGAAAGLAFYIHPMFLSVIVPHIGAAAWRYRMQLRTWWVPAVAGAVVVNAPFLGWSVANGLSAFDNDTAQPGSYLDRLSGFASGLMPRALGLMRVDGSWVLGKAVSILLLLLLVAIALAGVARLWRGSDAQRALAISAVAVWPLMGLFAAHGYVDDGRYGIIPILPLLICLVAGIESAADLRATNLLTRNLAYASLLGIWVGALTLPYLSRAVGPSINDPNATTNAVVARLRQAGVTRAAGSYWLVEPLAVWTQGTIVVKPTYPQPIRSQRMADIVDGAPPDTVAHVFFADQDWTQTLNMPIENYLREEVGGVIVYLPIDQK